MFVSGEVGSAVGSPEVALDVLDAAPEAELQSERWIA